MGDTGPTGRRMQLRQGHLPLLLHPSPARALYLGLGTGITALAATDHPALEVDAVELVPEVVEGLAAFVVEGRSLVDPPRARVHAADARRFVRTAENDYDVIVADLFHPARDGGGMLYTREHFQAVRERLRADGLFCQWLPLYQLDEQTLRDILRTFLTVFPNARASLHDLEFNFPALALVAPRGEWPRYGPGWMGERVRDEALLGALAEIDLDTDLNLFGTLMAEAGELQSYAGKGPHQHRRPPRRGLPRAASHFLAGKPPIRPAVGAHAVDRTPGDAVGDRSPCLPEGVERSARAAQPVHRTRPRAARTRGFEEHASRSAARQRARAHR